MIHPTPSQTIATTGSVGTTAPDATSWRPRPSEPQALYASSGRLARWYEDSCLREPHAAEYLDVSKYTLRAWRKAGRLPGYRLSPHIVVYRKGDLDRLVTTGRA